MYIRNMEIKNFKGIETCHLSFKPGFNLIIGENGKGKTSILEAAAIALSGFISGVPDSRVHQRQLWDEDIRQVYEKQGDGAYNPIPYPPEIHMAARLGNREYQWGRARKITPGAHTTTSPTDIRHAASDLLAGNGLLPVINYQSAARVWAQKRKKQYSIPPREKGTRTAGYIDCVDDESSVKMLEDWCVRMELISMQQKKPVREYEAVKETVARAMTLLEGEEVYVFYDAQVQELMYKKEGKVLPISVLSAGYQALIWMILDIAYRMAVLNPFLLDEVTQKTEGVVLIDELDLHLHPRWQWKAIDALRAAFPKVQFIATTHSPIVIASAKQVWCINIEDITQPASSYDGYGLEIDTILKRVQHAAELPEQVTGLLKDFYQAVEDMNFPKAEAHLRTLQQEIGENSPVAVKARERLDLEESFPEMNP